MIAQETRHLITFISRKSFTQWQREELHAWINANLDLLTGHPFCPEHLRNVVREEYSEALFELAKSLDNEHGFDSDEMADMRDLVDDVFDDDREFTDEQLRAFLRDPATFQEEVERYLNEQINIDDNLEDNSDDEFSQEYFFNSDQQSGEVKQKKLKGLFNASLLKKCYKSLASRLHPDKELDPTLKAEK